MIDVYDCTQNLSCDDSDWRDDEFMMLSARSSHGNGWEEAGMDAYNRYYEELCKRCP